MIFLSPLLIIYIALAVQAVPGAGGAMRNKRNLEILCVIFLNILLWIGGVEKKRKKWQNKKKKKKKKAMNE